MQTLLSPEFSDTRDGNEAEAILRKCVHCGFCNATCPTYQVLGDELDGPRGRIYLIKQMLEGGEVTQSTQLHLDRCLTCRNCETTCPSGVEYGRLLDIGRRLVDERVARPASRKAFRWLLKEGLTSALFAPALKVGQLFRPLLPASLRGKVPARAPPPPPDRLVRGHRRKVLLLAGCVQPAMIPNINRATVRVLDAAGIEAVSAGGEGCCGALRAHLSDEAGGLADMRRNIDAWWPHIESGAVECILVNASGCSHMVKQYGHALRHDTGYADKAARVSALARDLCELLPELAAALKGRIRIGDHRRLAFHPPCTLQHGQRVRGVESHLRVLGFEVALPNDSHLCCGSAGTYSLLEPKIAYELRDRKLANLAPLVPDCIVSSNIGCIQHLQSGTSTPVRHWVEVLDEALFRDSEAAFAARV
ncbi:MAG: glycolate oxidase subunit GlcF [Steroidobacteraceae bacterium]|jgi:glycolate dehydrogenase iron-sulfur subunit